MQRWQYGRLVVLEEANSGITRVTWNGKEDTSYNGMKVGEGKVRILNNLGNEGWELVTGDSSPSPRGLSVEYIFKRPG